MQYVPTCIFYDSLFMDHVEVELRNAKGDLLPMGDYWRAKKECLVDMINNRIFLNDKMLTSNDLRSQHFTVLFLYTLYNAEEKTVYPGMLPKVSYTSSKYDFHHKIIRPMEESVNKYLEKQFKVVCIGTLHNFVVKQVYSDIEIYFLRSTKESNSYSGL